LNYRDGIKANIVEAKTDAPGIASRFCSDGAPDLINLWTGLLRTPTFSENPLPGCSEGLRIGSSSSDTHLPY
jgi:hypothetical protein